MISGVIFDMDGVLTDSEEAINRAAITGLQEYGVEPLAEDFEPFVGMGEDHYIGGVAKKYDLDFQPDMKRRVYEIYLDLAPDMVKELPGVRDLIAFLRDRGIALAVASSADKVKVEANLKAIELQREWFDAIVQGEDVEQKKPAPDIFLEASTRINVPAEQCCVIEDSLAGVRAAKSADMLCVGVTSSFSGGKLLESGADKIVSTLETLCDVQSWQELGTKL